MIEERLAKIIARAGICSRREAEKLIISRQVMVDDQIITDCATKVDNATRIKINGKALTQKSPTRLWLYYKQKGLITTHHDPQGRPTVFSLLPKSLPRVISVGRLDYNSEGLLLLTNDGELSRCLELPSSKLKRTYRVRVFGKFDLKQLSQIKHGITIDAVNYKALDLELEQQTGNNSWFNITLTEGKNREVRKIFEYFGLVVNRLIRISYGPYQLRNMQPAQLSEVASDDLNKLKIMLKL